MWKVKRMNTARIVVLTIAVGAGGIAAYLASGSDRKVAAVAPTVQMQTVDVLVAKSDIPLGQTIQPNLLQWQAWPAATASDSFIRRDRRPDATTTLVGSIARSPFVNGEPIRDTKLVQANGAGFMVNGAGTVFIEVAGKIQKTGIRFRDNQQLLNICQRIVSQVGRRVDESSPICDARLADGSRVNAIVPPLAIDGPALTIRKFRRDKLTLEQLVKFGAISQHGADILQIIGRCRANVLISGGTGSGKTTLLNCLTHYIESDERIITCEDAAELQLQQPHGTLTRDCRQIVAVECLDQ